MMLWCTLGSLKGSEEAAEETNVVEEIKATGEAKAINSFRDVTEWNTEACCIRRNVNKDRKQQKQVLQMKQREERRGLWWRILSSAKHVALVSLVLQNVLVVLVLRYSKQMSNQQRQLHLHLHNQHLLNYNKYNLHYHKHFQYQKTGQDNVSVSNAAATLETLGVVSEDKIHTHMSTVATPAVDFSRSGSDDSDNNIGGRYLNSAAVVCSEVLKLLFWSSLMVWHERRRLTVAKTSGDTSSWRLAEALGWPVEFLQVGVPAVLYVVQNNLVFVSLSHLPGAVHQVTYQLKILFTAVLSVWLLKKRLPKLKWLALFVLTVGVALIQLAPPSDSTNSHYPNNNSISSSASSKSAVTTPYYQEHSDGQEKQQQTWNKHPHFRSSQRCQLLQQYFFRAFSKQCTTGSIIPPATEGSDYGCGGGGTACPSSAVGTSASIHSTNKSIASNYTYLANRNNRVILPFSRLHMLLECASWTKATITTTVLMNTFPKQRVPLVKDVQQEEFLVTDILNGENRFIGICAVLCACITSGLAGVYLEKLLKQQTTAGSTTQEVSSSHSSSVVTAKINNMSITSSNICSRNFNSNYGSSYSSSFSSCSTCNCCNNCCPGSSIADVGNQQQTEEVFHIVSTDVNSHHVTNRGVTSAIWARNVQLSIYGVVFGLLASEILDGDSIRKYGFFQGFDTLAVTVVMLQAAGGIVVAAVLCFSDNILKCFANAVSLILSTVASQFIFHDFVPNMFFLQGTTLVIVATCLYFF